MTGTGWEETELTANEKGAASAATGPGARLWVQDSLLQQGGAHRGLKGRADLIPAIFQKMTHRLKPLMKTGAIS